MTKTEYSLHEQNEDGGSALPTEKESAALNHTKARVVIDGRGSLYLEREA